MRQLSIICFFCTLALPGCTIFGLSPHDTAPMNSTDLAIKHVYKMPKKMEPHQTRLNDPQLYQLISLALADAPDMRSANARVMRARQLAQGAYAALWPSATLNGDLQRQHFSFQGTVPPPFNELVVNKLNAANIAMNFNYEIDFWGKNKEALASRLSEAYAAQMDCNETRLVLSSAITTTYFELQNNIIQQQLAKKNVRLQQQLSDIVVDRAKQGIESDIPVKTAISNAQIARLSVEDYKRAEMQSRHQLAVLTGKNPFNTKIDPAKFTYDKKQLVLPAIMPANLLAQRPDIASARALTEAAAHQINIAKTAFYPNVNLRGLLSAESLYFSNFFNLSFQTEGIKAAVDLPVFDAGTRRANLGVKYSEYEIAVNQYNKSILNALRQATDQISAMQTLDKQVQDQTQALNGIEANYKLFQSRYNQGIIDYVQLIEIKQLLLQQKAVLRTLQTRQKQAFVALLTALGDEV